MAAKEFAVPSEAYQRAREVLEKKGFTIFVIKPKSLTQLLDEKGKYFDYVNPSPEFRNIVPKAGEVAINIQQVFLPESDNRPQKEQLEMIKSYGAKLKKDTGLEDIEVVMSHASIYAQLDIAYQEQNNGKKLFPDFFARTRDLGVGPLVANVGRCFPDDRLLVGGWSAGHGIPVVRAVPVVVLLRK